MNKEVQIYAIEKLLEVILLEAKTRTNAGVDLLQYPLPTDFIREILTVMDKGFESFRLQLEGEVKK